MTDVAATPPVGSRMGLGRRHSDERLVRRAKKGDRQAFEAIFTRYHQNLYRFCLVLVGNQQDAEDALQSTMVKVLRSLPGERRSIQLRPWIYRIARNEAIDTVRRRRESAAVEPEDLPAGAELATSVEARERLRLLISDFAQLPERQRAALVMRELSDLDFAEIASALGTSAAAARQTIYEGRVSLRQMEAGREMSCGQVLWELSEGDGRVTRRRDIQAHLRACSECRAFQDGIARRSGELKALAPLPAVASAALLQSILGGGSSAAGGGIAGAAGAGAGNALVSSAVVKTAATCAVVAAIGTTAADRGGLIDVPIGRDRDQAREISAPADSNRARGVDSPAGTGAGAEAGHRPGSQGSSSFEKGQSGSGNAGLRTQNANQNANRGGGSRSGHAGGHSSPHPAPGHRPTHAGLKAGGGGQGKADGLPPASGYGQQTASGRKPSQANASPGTQRGSANGPSTAPARPAPSPSPPEASPPPRPAPEPPTSGKSGSALNGTPSKPVEELEPSE
jgi:RNA polymerase sigma factor (sigma-70 family)